MPQFKQYFVYIMTNRSRTLYVGVTSDLDRRTYQHQLRTTGGFTSRYNIDRLVYYETASDPVSAIRREKEIKGWLRRKKIALIESVNPQWRDMGIDWRSSEPDPSLRSG